MPEGATILDACRSQGVDTPTLCFADNLTPVNACRVCVVEVEGARTLVPACSRTAEDGMKVKTDTERVERSPQAGAGAAGLERRDGPDQPRRPPLDAATTRRIRTGSGHDATAPPRASATRANRAITTTRRPDGGRRRRPAHQDRQRALRARLLALHPLLQVRGGLRRRRAEHVRDRGCRARVRRPDLDGVSGRPRRERVRLLRELHRGLSHRRVDVHLRTRDARSRHVGRRRSRPSPARSVRTAASAASSTCMSRTTRS